MFEMLRNTWKLNRGVFQTLVTEREKRQLGTMRTQPLYPEPEITTRPHSNIDQRRHEQSGRHSINRVRKVNDIGNDGVLADKIFNEAERFHLSCLDVW